MHGLSLTSSSNTIIMRTSALTACIVATLASLGPAAAQTAVDRTVATPATGSVEVSNVSGSVRVSGWNRAEVRVTGTLGEGTERLDVTSSGDRVSIRVIIPEGRRNVQGSNLEIRLPAGKDLTVRTVSASVVIADVSGAVDGRSTSGSVRISGSPRAVRATSTSGEVQIDATTGRVEAASTSGNVRVTGQVRESISAESVSGEVDVRAPTPELLAKSVSGDVTISGITRRLSASSVSGSIDVRNGRLQYGSFESVSGNLGFTGELEPDAALNFQSHSGSIRLAIPGSLGARFQVTTFSGDIRNGFGATPERTSRYGPGEELRFSTGNGGALITVKTFSGDVSLERR